MVAAVDDSGPVRTGEDVGGGERSERPQDGGLRPKGHLLSVTQQTCRKGALVLRDATTELGRTGWLSAMRLQDFGKE